MAQEAEKIILIWEGKMSKILSILDRKEIVIYKTYDDEDDRYKIVALWWDDLADSFKIGYANKEARDKAWDETGVDKYEAMFASAKNLIRSD